MSQGEQLKKLLNYRNKTVKWLANKMDIAPTTFYSIIKRETNFKESYIAQMALYLSVNPIAIEYFLNGEISIETLLSIETDATRLHLQYDDSNHLKEIRAGYNLDIESDRADKLIDDFDKLNEAGQMEAVKRVEELTQLKQYASDGIGHRIIHSFNTRMKIKDGKVIEVNPKDSEPHSAD